MRRWLILLCVSCVMGARAETPADAGALAHRLVRAMNSGELSAMGLRKATDNLRKQGMSDAQVECVRRVEAEDFVPALAAVAATELTPAELQEALTFYESASGRKYVAMTMVKSAAALGEPAGGEMPVFNAKEIRISEKFGKTAVFHKLVNENVLTRSATGRARMQDAAQAIFRRCGVGV
jgi:hypothetical protein